MKQKTKDDLLAIVTSIKDLSALTGELKKQVFEAEYTEMVADLDPITKLSLSNLLEKVSTMFDDLFTIEGVLQDIAIKLDQHNGEVH